MSDPQTSTDDAAADDATSMGHERSAVATAEAIAATSPIDEAPPEKETDEPVYQDADGPEAANEPEAAGEPGAADAKATEDGKHWYVLKVASNRERTVKKALERQIKRENLEEFFGDIVIPTQKVKETKNGKVVEKEEKIWPGYIVVNMAINDDSWYLVRSVSGIGDFAGKSGEPSPMPPDEVDALFGAKTEAAPGEEKEPEPVKINIPFNVGDRVKINDGTFEGSEGDVTAIDPETGEVQVTLQFLGRSTDVPFEHWKLEKV